MSVDTNKKQPRHNGLDLTPKRRVSYAYNNSTGRPLTDEDLKRYAAKNEAWEKRLRKRPSE